MNPKIETAISVASPIVVAFGLLLIRKVPVVGIAVTIAGAVAGHKFKSQFDKDVEAAAAHVRTAREAKAASEAAMAAACL